MKEEIFDEHLAKGVINVLKNLLGSFVALVKDKA